MDLANIDDRYLYGSDEPASKVIERLRTALEYMRSCEVADQMGADDVVVLDALHSYDAFKRANTNAIASALDLNYPKPKHARRRAR
jgi:cyanate lyase